MAFKDDAEKLVEVVSDIRDLLLELGALVKEREEIRHGR